MLEAYDLIVTAQGNASWAVLEDGSRAVDKVCKQLGESAREIIVVGDASRDNLDVIGVKNISLPRTQGATCTAVAGFDFIDGELPVVIASGDSYFATGDVAKSIVDFMDQEHEVFSLTTNSEDARMSYIDIAANGAILAFHEKIKVSNIATTGIFVFKKPEIFLESAAWVLENNMALSGNFYMSSAINYFIMKGQNVSHLDTSKLGFDYRKIWEVHEDR